MIDQHFGLCVFFPDTIDNFHHKGLRHGGKFIAGVAVEYSD